jgi:hypothetical protein
MVIGYSGGRLQDQVQSSHGQVALAIGIEKILQTQ